MVAKKKTSRIYSNELSKHIIQISRYLDSLGHKKLSVDFINHGDGFEFTCYRIDESYDNIDKPYRKGLMLDDFIYSFSQSILDSVVEPISIEDNHQEYFLSIEKDDREKIWRVLYSYSETILTESKKTETIGYPYLSGDKDYESLISLMKKNGIEKITSSIDSPFDDVNIESTAHFLDGSSSSSFLDEVYQIRACSGDTLSYYLDEYCNKEHVDNMPDWSSSRISGGEVTIMQDGSRTITRRELSHRLEKLVDREPCLMKIPISPSKSLGTGLCMD